MRESADEAGLDAISQETRASSAVVRSNTRKSIRRAAWNFGAWVAFLTTLGLIYSYDEHGFWRWTNALTRRDYGRYGLGVVMIVVLLIIFPPFILAAMLTSACFELVTGRPFGQIEAWFGGLNWRRKCLVVPALATPIAILSYALIWLGTLLVRYYVKHR
jgi:hypothetical protein